MAKYTALDIAKWFLYYNNVVMNDTDADLMTNLKLQKLLYYAQGCYLATNDRVLFDDKIVAWEHGPVVVNVYNNYKNYSGKGIEYNGEYQNNISNEDEEILKEVYNIFAKYSAWGLRNMTHNETPWKETRRNGVIQVESIEKYFKEHYLA